MFDSGEVVVRGAAFALVFGLLLLLERWAPLRPRGPARGRRVADNLALLVLGIVATRVVLPVGVVGAAFLAQRHGWGLLPRLHVRFAVAFTLGLLLLDFAVYLQHRLSHAWTPLWRLHRVHHSDRDLDLTSAFRFHPGEIAFSALFKAAVVMALGAAPAAVLVFEVLLNATAMFNHANLALAPRFDRVLRAGLVTPAMHWTHHSIRADETRHNFGFCLSLWDRWCGSYQAQPQAGYAALELGISGLAEQATGILSLLAQPARDLAEPPDGAYVGPGSAVL